MKLLITGASGLYGSKLAQLALARGFEVYSSDIQELSVYGNFVRLNVADREQVLETIKKLKPDVVVHAASLTDVDKCEVDKALAWKVNVEGTKNVADACEETESFLFYVSTDYVFSGEKGCYVESDSPEPLNYYGLTKLEAEIIVYYLPNSCVVRPSVIYGATPAAGKVNFALWLIESLRKGNRVKIVKDQWITPTLNTNLAEMTLEVVDRRLTGVYHLCGATRVSRLEFAQQIAEVFGLDKSLIDKVTTSQFNWMAQRPTDSSLDTSKAQRQLKCKPLPLAAALKQLKHELSPEPHPE
ncbi:MAG: dTDP-4-dehydrorhamnose reductase [Candidatus Bathyarchaeota archaeon]|nr:dTDP-4-dehydrorhamnose reductase [Candidatus Bathyarchaeota archaeon]